jgi:hypothetical protein
MPVGYLTSSTLIDTVKREAMIPTSQSTFTSADFLAIANQEMRVGLVPSIMQYHQEYYVRDSAPILISPNQNNYPIPYRAVGGKFRDAYYLDQNNNLRAMTRIFPDDRPYYQQTNFQNRFLYFFIQGNDIVLMPDVGDNPVGFIVFSFYMRPNELVDQSRVATIKNISITGSQGNITNITATNPSIITSANHGLTTGNIINITQTNSDPQINGNWAITVIDANTFSIQATVLTTGTTGLWTFNTTAYTVDQIPTGFSTSTLLDLMQTNPGHKTYSFDQIPLSVDTTNKIITFNTTQTQTTAFPPNVGASPVVGDYISFAGECIIPQAPSDLHDLLAQRVVLRCLQALGDTNGMQMAQSKLAEMEKWAGYLIDNRSEGEPVKANNLRGLLRSSKIRKRGWL